MLLSFLNSAILFPNVISYSIPLFFKQLFLNVVATEKSIAITLHFDNGTLVGFTIFFSNRWLETSKIKG